MDVDFLASTLLALLGALPLTLNLASVSVAFGLAGALAVALMRVSGVAALDLFARSYVYVFRGTPLLIQILLIY